MSVLNFFGLSDRGGTPGPLEDYWYGAVGRKTVSGVTVNEETAMNYSVAWACTMLLSSSGSSLPLNLFRRDGKNKSVATGHPVQRLVHLSPNPEMSSMSFRGSRMNMQINWGNAYAEIQRNSSGTPIENKRFSFSSAKLSSTNVPS